MNERIVLDPSIHHGKPVIKGTRVPVATVIGALAGGMSTQDVSREYDIQIADIGAALEYSMTIDASAAIFTQLDVEERKSRRDSEPK